MFLGRQPASTEDEGTRQTLYPAARTSGLQHLRTMCSRCLTLTLAILYGRLDLSCCALLMGSLPCAGEESAEEKAGLLWHIIPEAATLSAI